MPKKPVIKDNKLPDGQTFEDLLRTPPSASTNEGTSVSTDTGSTVQEEVAAETNQPKAEIKTEATPTETKTEVPKAFVYDEFWNSLPEEGRGEILRRYNQDLTNYQNEVNKNLQEQYGELYDPEFLKLIASNKPLQKKLKKLSDVKLQEWFGHAYDQYETEMSGGSFVSQQEQSAIPKEVREELNELKEWKAAQERSKSEEAQNEIKNKAQQEYTQRRTVDAQAVKTEYPELQWKVANETDPAYKLCNYIHSMAEYESAKQQRYVSYKEIYDAHRLLTTGRPTPPPAIPATSEAGPPNQPQAPMNAADSKNKFLQQVKKSGGTFDQFALSVAGNKNNN